MFLQGIKLEEQKPGPQKNKVGWAGDRDRGHSGLAGFCYLTLSISDFHHEPLK